jgi:hypothetical protein
MEVGLFPNTRRPGIGKRPHREGQRPLLPQHARHCPVLEAGSAMGFMVHPPLGENELFQIGYEGEGRYVLTYSVNATGRKWEPVFTISYQMPAGGIGGTKEEITMHIHTPAGAVTMRGAWNFQTPPGWDTVYLPILNSIERPVAPMLVIRVETDWYVHDTEFRYVLAPGETISASHAMPIGQVAFIPREEITFRDGTDEEIAQRLKISEEFFEAKAASKVKTPYGLEFSPHYQRTQRQNNK